MTTGTQTVDDLRERMENLQAAKRAVLRQIQDLDPTDSWPVATLWRHLDRLESEANRIDYLMDKVKKDLEKAEAIELKELVYNLAERVAALEAEVILLKGRTEPALSEAKGWR